MHANFELLLEEGVRTYAQIIGATEPAVGVAIHFDVLTRQVLEV